MAYLIGTDLIFFFRGDLIQDKFDSKICGYLDNKENDNVLPLPQTLAFLTPQNNKHNLFKYCITFFI